MSDHCPLCDSDDISRHERQETINGWTDNYRYSVCGDCGAEFVFSDQARENERRFLKRLRAESR